MSKSAAEAVTVLPSSAANALGHAGLLPFVAGAVAVWWAPEPWPALAFAALSTYAAVIVSFLGGVHWAPGLREGDAGALAWGVVPSLLAWAGLLMPPTAGLLVQAAALVTCYAVDRRRYPAYGLAGALGLRLRLTVVAAASCLAGAAGALAAG